MSAAIFISQINEAKAAAAAGNFDHSYQELGRALDASDWSEADLAAVDAAHAEIKKAEDEARERNQ